MAMRKKKDIEGELDKLKRLRAVMPEMTAFGDSNWKKLDSQIVILERVVSGKWSEFDVEERKEEYEDEYEVNQDRIEACEWVMDEGEDELCSETDIETFTDKKKRENPDG